MVSSDHTKIEDGLKRISRRNSIYVPQISRTLTIHVNKDKCVFYKVKSVIDAVVYKIG